MQDVIISIQHINDTVFLKKAVNLIARHRFVVCVFFNAKRLK
jgi:hypothetical protein